MSERGRCVQPAGGRAVVGGEDRRASLPATRASGDMARVGAPPLLGETDQHVAPPAPSRHEMSPLRQRPKLIRWGRKAMELARRHRSVARRGHSVLPELRTIARSDREQRGPSPRQLRVQASRRRAPELVVDYRRRSPRTRLGPATRRSGFESHPPRWGLPERNALRSRRQRSMMAG